MPTHPDPHPAWRAASAAYRARMLQKGFVEVKVWCRVEDRPKLRQIASELREAREVDPKPTED